MIDGTPVRGQLISLDASWVECSEHNREVSDRAQGLLAEALLAVTLLASTLKIDGRLTLQIRGQGAIHLLVAQASSQRGIRGLVRQSHALSGDETDLQQIFQSDKIVITIDSGKGQPHQGIAPLSGASLAEALQGYFEHSEQLPTRLWLTSHSSSACGLLLQKLPGEFDDEDGWNRITQLAATITDQELLELDQNQLLQRLFHEETIRVFDAEPVRFECSCSHDRTLGMVKSLGQSEALDILQQQGVINISCEFCNAQYNFTAVDIERLFDSADSLPSNQTRH